MVDIFVNEPALVIHLILEGPPLNVMGLELAISSFVGGGFISISDYIKITFSIKWTPWLSNK